MTGPLPSPSPVPEFEVDPTAVAQVAQHVLEAATMVDDVGAFVAGKAQPSGLEGSANDDYEGSLPGLRRRADAYSLALRGVARAVYHHTDTLVDLQARHAALVAWRGRLLDVPAHLARLAADDVTGSAVSGALQVATAEAGSYESALSRWRADVSAAEDEVIAAFRRMMTADQAERRYTGAPDPGDLAVESIPGPEASPSEVAAWWRSLTRAQRWGLIGAYPARIGNRDGIPAWARDHANRTRLDRDLGELGRVPAAGRTAAERRRYANARAARDALDELTDVVDPITMEQPCSQVYVYGPDAFDGDGALAISVGDLDDADHVAVTVPGFGTDMGSASVQVDKPIALYQAARFLDPGSTTAAMFWIGYDAPDLPDGTGNLDAGGVIAERMAAAGGDRLADTLDGIDAMRAGDDRVHLTVIGHSYGATTLGHALHDHVPGVDDAVFVGSPGSGDHVEHASDLHVPTSHVWVGANSHDPITELGDTGRLGLGSIDGLGLGRNPAEDVFGAHRFEAEDATRGATSSLSQHADYFRHDTESLWNMTQIVTGHDHAVTTVPGVHDGPFGPDDAWDGATRAGDALDHLGHAAAHPDALASDARSIGGDALEIGRDTEGRPDDPEWDRAPTQPTTHATPYRNAS